MKKVHKSYIRFEVLLAEELAKLRKGEGLTPVKLQNTPALRTAISRAANLAEQSLSGSQVHIFLIEELEKLKPTRNIQALRNALGINDDGSTLSERRQSLAASLKKHPDTIERYENEGTVEFALHLVALQPSAASGRPQPTPLYIQRLEEQAAKSRAATALGLSGILSLEQGTQELITFLESSPRPYLDASIDISLLPSERGGNWYSMAVAYTFRGSRSIFRLAVVTANEDGELLMKRGLVDEFHKLNDEIDPTLETRKVINGNRFTLKNSITGRQRLLRFREASSHQLELFLQSVGEPLLGSCRLLEVVIPEEWQTPYTLYEYYSKINLRDDIHYIYWYAPSLMYVKKLSFDYSQFPNVHNWHFIALPFLGHTAGIAANHDKQFFVLHPNSWIMPGHGISLMWNQA